MQTQNNKSKEPATQENKDSKPEPLVEEQYEKTRLESFEGKDMFPHKFHVTCIFEEYISKYNKVNAGDRLKDNVESIAGRVLEIRKSGAKLYFITVTSNGNTLQVISDIREYMGTNFHQGNNVSRGDIIGITNGFAGKSLKGELSIYTTCDIQILAPCFKFLAKQNHGLTDPDLRIKTRWIDMITNPFMINNLKTRHQVFTLLRQFLNYMGFTEVHTPVVSENVGGASAKPFTTFHNDLKKAMFMRISPELYLKKLVVGGLDRVYEIGPQFRNESIDTTHNPEFYSLEFYIAYSDYNDIMQICEKMLSHIVKKIHGTTQIKYNYEGKDIEIDFAPPYRKIDIISELEKLTEVTFPDDLTTDASEKFLNELCRTNKIECSEPRTICRLLDKLIGHYIEPQCINPTYVMNHPAAMSVLAKQHRTNPHLTERFELFVCGMELANAYTELNNPQVQKERFDQQLKEKNSGNDEAQSVDDGFIDALKTGLPPTGGFGLGIERFIMILTNSSTIKDVIAFPL